MGLQMTPQVKVQGGQVQCMQRQLTQIMSHGKMSALLIIRLKHALKCSSVFVVLRHVSKWRDRILATTCEIANYIHRNKHFVTECMFSIQ